MWGPALLEEFTWHQTQIPMPSSASWQGRRLPINTPGGHLCPAGVGLQWGQFGWPVTVSFRSEDTQPVLFLLTQHSRRRHSPEDLGWPDTHGALCQHYKVSQSKGMLTQPSSPCGWIHPTRVFFQLVNNTTILHMVEHSNVSNRKKKKEIVWMPALDIFGRNSPHPSSRQGFLLTFFFFF